MITRWKLSTLLCAGALLVKAGIATAQSCRIPQRFPGATAASMDFKADLNANLGDWGTIFMDVDTDGCEITARDFLQSKLERQNLDANGWKGGLRGGDVYLVTAAALRLGGRGLLTPAIHGEVLEALASYDFANWGGPCARGAGNGCMDDYTVAAAGHAWAGAYLSITQSTTPARDAAWFLAEARRYIKLSLSPQDTLCVRAVPRRPRVQGVPQRLQQPPTRAMVIPPPCATTSTSTGERCSASSTGSKTPTTVSVSSPASRSPPRASRWRRGPPTSRATTRR